MRLAAVAGLVLAQFFSLPALSETGDERTAALRAALDAGDTARAQEAQEKLETIVETELQADVLQSLSKHASDLTCSDSNDVQAEYYAVGNRLADSYDGHDDDLIALSYYSIELSGRHFLNKYSVSAILYSGRLKDRLTALGRAPIGGAGPLRLLAVYHLKVPRIDPKLAAETYRMALEIAPNRVANRLGFALALHEMGKKNEARFEVDQVKTYLEGKHYTLGRDVSSEDWVSIYLHRIKSFPEDDDSCPPPNSDEGQQ